MVYTDGVHLVADSLRELHAFAHSLGLRGEWFQGKRRPHYDLTTPRALARALANGAQMVGTRDVVCIARTLAQSVPE